MTLYNTDTFVLKKLYISYSNNNIKDSLIPTKTLNWDLRNKY